MSRVVLALALSLLSAAAHAQQVDYVSWRDPNEGAFTAEVPRGWGVVGGLIRPAPGDIRIVLELRSPDGRIDIGVGDRDLPTFGLPTPLYTQMGARQGTRIDNGVVLSDYEPGELFAQDYGSVVFGRACGHSVTVSGHQSVAIKQSGVPGIPNSSSTAGIAMFRCDDPHHGFVALAMGRTNLMPFTGVPGGIWMADDVVRLASTPDIPGPTVLAIAEHAMGTLKTDPQWEARELQAQYQAALAKLQAQGASPPAGESVADYQHRVFEEVRQGRAQSQDKAAANFSDYIGDRQRLVDPNTGTLYVAPSGSTTYSLAPDGGVVGSVGPNAPSGNTTLEPQQ